MTTAELAARWGVSTQTVRKRLTLGLPHAGKDRAGGYLFDPDAAERWKADNTGAAPRGGVRPNAGRKPGRRRRNADTPSPIEAAAAVADRAARETLPNDPLRAGDLLNITAEELRALVALAPEESRLTKAQAERLKTLQEARRLHRMEREADGTLVDAGAVRMAFARELAGYRQRVEQLASTLAARLAGLVDTEDAGRAVRETVAEEVDKLVAEIGSTE